MKKTHFKNKLKKFIFVLPILLVVFSLVCVPVSAQSNTMNPYLEIYSYGLFTNTITGKGFQLPGNIDDHLVFPDNSVFNNAISIWLPYSSVILNSSQYGYQDFWINPYRVGQYSMTFAVNYNNYRISDIVVESDYFKFVDSSYDYIGIETINSVPYYMVKFNFYVSNVTANEVGNTGGWIRVGLQSYKNNITTFAAFVTDITFSDGTSEIIDNQNKNTQSIIDNQNSNTQAEIEADKENTDKILNGWDTDAAPDENTTDNYSDIEHSLIDGTQDNADNANVEVTDNFIGSLQRYVSGFSAVSQMFSDLLLVQAPDVNGIVWFSLAMGVVPLIVGLSVQGLRSSDRAAARKRSSGRKKG